MAEKICERCKQMINTDKDMFVTLGTHKGKDITDMAYFHFNCWRLHFEEKARQKAEAVVNGMQERMMPIANQLVGKLRNAMDEDGDQVININ